MPPTLRPSASFSFVVPTIRRGTALRYARPAERGSLSLREALVATRTRTLANILRQSPDGDDRDFELVRFDERDETVRAKGVRHAGAARREGSDVATVRCEQC